MTETPTRLAPPDVRLPDIALRDLPERTKDFLLAHSAAGKPVSTVVVDVLNQAAADAGFTPGKAA